MAAIDRTATPAESDIHNDGEIWKTIPEFPDYEASNLGRIRSLPRVRTDAGGRNGGIRNRNVPGVILRPGLHKGYPHVALTVDSKGYTMSVHRLVLEAFVGPRPDGMECRHLDGNRENARLDNLVWGTPSENQLDREEHETSNTGERHPQAKLSELDVIEIKWRLESGEQHQDIADDFEVSRSCIGSINSERLWDHVKPFRCTYCMDDDKLRIYSSYRFSDQVKEQIKNAGFRWAPKQECWFCVWSIRAEDLCSRLSGFVEDEDYSPEERAADRAERFGGYRDKRRSEAGAYADRFEAGPDAHGYQNAARAERAAARHDRQRDRALCQWSKAEYWQARTAGVISHALHKSDPETRRGRILVIERDLRKAESNRQESIDVYDGWKMVATMEGAEELLPQDGETKPNAAGAKAYNLANHYHGGGFKRDEEEANQAYRDCHRREPAFSAYDLLTANTFIRVPVRRLSPKEVAEKYLAKYRDPRTPETANNRYIEHLRNRLIYENAMLENEGGNASNVDMIPGGFITYRNKWGNGPAAEYQILKVNKSPATKRVTSVEIIAPRTIHRMGRMLEEVGGVLVNIERKGENIYRAPTPEELEAFQNRKKARKAATPTISTINPTNEDAQKLQDLWNAEALAKHGESAGVVPVKYMTQAEFSSGLKHNYVFICEVKIGETPVKLRLKRGGGFYNYHAARQVIVLTDKPQKPLPAIPQAEPVEPVAAGQLF